MAATERETAWKRQHSEMGALVLLFKGAEGVVVILTLSGLNEEIDIGQKGWCIGKTAFLWTHGALLFGCYL